jgi:membrane-associated protease RseP (regulator of RpoE activity)
VLEVAATPVPDLMPPGQAVVVPKPIGICELGPRAFDPLLGSIEACQPPPLYYGPPPTPPLPLPPSPLCPPPCAPPCGEPPPGPTPACKPVPIAGEPVSGLGVTVTFADEGGGVLVLAVAPESPAAFAGLVRGDRILAINEQLISTPATLTCYIRRKLPGSRISIAYWRDGAIQSTNTILMPKEMIPGGQPESRPVPIWQAHHDRIPAQPITNS